MLRRTPKDSMTTSSVGRPGSPRSHRTFYGPWRVNVGILGQFAHSACTGERGNGLPDIGSSTRLDSRSQILGLHFG